MFDEKELEFPRLENWFYDENIRVFYGEIYNDVTKRRFPDGYPVRTSYLSYNPSLVEGNIIRTQNTIYVLGKRRTNK